jgi:hypothetical protein
MAIISEHNNILKFMSGIHESRVIKLRKNKSIKTCCTHKEGGVCVRNFNQKAKSKFSNLIVDEILIGK